VDERGGLQGVARALALEVAAGNFMEFLVDHRQELLERGPIAFAPI
jgi:hypothetical protein